MYSRSFCTRFQLLNSLELGSVKTCLTPARNLCSPFKCHNFLIHINWTIKYSCVFVLISLINLVSTDKIQKKSSFRTRLVGLISPKTKEYFFWPPFMHSVYIVFAVNRDMMYARFVNVNVDVLCNFFIVVVAQLVESDDGC